MGVILTWIIETDLYSERFRGESFPDNDEKKNRF